MRRETLLHLLFVLSVVFYGIIGGLIPSRNPVLPPQYSMFYLLPGIISALVGIQFYRRAREREDMRVTYWLMGDALVEFLAILGLVVFLVTGEKIPLWTGCGLSLLVMMMHFP